MSHQCTSCGRIVTDQHNCRDADEADIKLVRDRLEEALRRVHAIQGIEASELAGVIDGLIKHGFTVLSIDAEGRKELQTFEQK